MGKKHGTNPKKKPGKTEKYKSLNQAYDIESYPPFLTHYVPPKKNNDEEQQFKHKNKLNWTYKEPKEYYKFLVDMFGKPDVLGSGKGGIAIWNKSLQNREDVLTGFPNIYKKIEIKDERVKHACPAEHIDFVYSYLNILITPKQLSDVMKLSGSINYDMLKHELFARCGSLEANIATLYMCSHIILSHLDDNPKYMSIEYIHENGEYGKHINSTTDPNFVKEMYRELSENLKLINKTNKLPNTYWPGAFNDTCGSPY